MKTSRGFSLFEVIAVLAVIVIVGVVGYLAYTNFIAKPAPANDSAASNTSAESEDKPVTVNSKADLEKISSELDSMSVDDEDAGQYDSAAGSF